MLIHLKTIVLGLPVMGRITCVRTLSYIFSNETKYRILQVYCAKEVSQDDQLGYTYAGGYVDRPFVLSRARKTHFYLTVNAFSYVSYSQHSISNITKVCGISLIGLYFLLENTQN